ncbi:hypothetical protein ABZW30_19745 [Kitasatospora sp. NPDC004669]|uniref:hypothetical protein n=1 Tax=Kitasatospora sp. NPDC004669 TaxID=3154555 RepID=UPI0033ACC950
MAEGSSYTIQAGGAEGQAKALDKASLDQDKIRAATIDPVDLAENVYGGEDADPAYQNFRTAWQSETTVIQGALSELALKVRLSSHNYQKAESAAVAGLREAASGGDYRPFG